MMVCADRCRLAQLLSNPHCALARGDRIIQPIDEVELPREQFEELGLLLLIQRATLLERDGEELGGLGMRARAGRGDARIACATPDPVNVGGAQCMVGQHRRVDV